MGTGSRTSRTDFQACPIADRLCAPPSFGGAFLLLMSFVFVQRLGRSIDVAIGLVIGHRMPLSGISEHVHRTAVSAVHS